jgi:hypothetical protein
MTIGANFTINGTPAANPALGGTLSHPVIGPAGYRQTLSFNDY